MAGPSACQQLQRLLNEALQILQDEGEVYRRIKSQDELYHVGYNRIFTHIFYFLKLSGLKKMKTKCGFNIVVFSR